MSTTVKTGWLEDKNGNKFAPKTLLSQVQTNDGVLLEDKIQADLDSVIANASSVYETKEDASEKITGVKTQLNSLSTLVGDTAVSQQISAAIDINSTELDAILEEVLV